VLTYPIQADPDCAARKLFNEWQEENEKATVSGEEPPVYLVTLVYAPVGEGKEGEDLPVKSGVESYKRASEDK